MELKKNKKKNRDGKKTNTRVFLDYAAATPLDRRVFKAMKPFLEGNSANSSALYHEGVLAKKALVNAREKVARILGCRKEEIVFTSGGTESNNLAILGVFEAARKAGVKSPHIITSVIEHPAILEVCHEVERRGGKVTYLKVDQRGHISLNEFQKSLTKTTCLVTLGYANSEIGVIIPIKKISHILNTWKEEKSHAQLYFHIDAGQAPNYISLNPNNLGVDLITIDGSKMYGPKGSSILCVKRKVAIAPLMYGGAQERGFRPGTENLPAILGIAEALVIASYESEKESKRLMPLRDYFIASLLALIPGSSLNGDQEDRLPNNVSICFPRISAEFAVIKLDSLGVACSTASSCRTLSNESYSYVIGALGVSSCAESSLRFTLGRKTNKKEIDYAIRMVGKALASR